MEERKFIDVDSTKNTMREDVRGYDSLLVVGVAINLIFLIILFSI